MTRAIIHDTNSQKPDKSEITLLVMSLIVQYKTAKVNNLDIFYREAGNPSLPTIILLHGHASSSHTFRDLIPLIADQFHVIAPDYPGFGNSSRPNPNEYKYTFVNIADTIDKFTEIIGLEKFAVYLFDFGAPVGLLMASKHPERITGIFSQSGNAYDEGLSPAFAGIRKFWADPSPANREPLTHIFSPEGLTGAYTLGVEPASRVAPDGANLDIYYMSREGALQIQLDNLLKDYETNVKSYPQWQAYLRQHKPKLVAIWGKSDPFFIPPGAEAFKRDLPDADVSIIEGGHFLNDSNPQAIAAGIKKLL
jgi:pimeloyl-ACP methyl ester carboxylesterase